MNKLGKHKFEYVLSLVLYRFLLNNMNNNNELVIILLRPRVTRINILF